MKYIVFLILVSLWLVLPATNSMPLLTTMIGAFPGSSLGHAMCSIDFNGDGMKDLVALEKNWNPNGVLDFSTGKYGRLHFYWGGTNFDNESDFVITGEYHLQYGQGWILNVGDVNNDGIEDLCYWGKENQILKICIFYGRQNPISTPDFVLQFPATQFHQIGYLHSLGDINNDGHADIGYVLDYENNSQAVMRVLDGESLESIDLYHISWGPQGSSLRGIGDVNNDEIDDYLVTMALSATESTHSMLSVHYGSSSFPGTDSLLISPDTNSLIVPTACPLGDVNGDGIDDFTSFINSESVKVWFGSSNLTGQWDIACESLSYGGYTWGPYTSGDFNDDGFYDIVTSNYNYGLNDGRAYLWMGGNQFNGIVDLVFDAPPGGFGEQFGWSMATGDFNVDGYCDLAISQPFSPSGPLWSSGRIYFYSGNAQLIDTTVSNDDPVAPPIQSEKWEYNIFPNPMQHGKLGISIIKSENSLPSPDNICIYNIKGQLVIKSELMDTDWQQGTVELNIPNLPSGVYLVRLSNQQGQSSTKKVMIAK